MKNLALILLFASLCSEIQSQQWVQQVLPAPVRPLYSVNAVNANVVWACGEQGTVLYTSNGGANWLFRGGGALGNNTVYSIAAFSAANVLCAVNNAQYGFIYRTTNAGLNWTQVFMQPNGFINDIRVLSYVAPSAYANGNPVDGRWTLLRTTNGGITFDTTNQRLPQFNNESGWPNDMAVNGSNIWFGTNNFRIYRSTNGGITWSFATIISQNTYAITFNGTNGYAVGDLAYYSTNSGIGWTVMPNLPGTGLFYTVANTGSNFWYGRGSQIYYSSNSGSSFSLQYTSPLNSIFRQLTFISSASDNVLTTIQGWGASNIGEMVHYADPFGIIKISSEVPQSFQLFQNYPNPFNPETKIKFNVPYPSFVVINIYNIEGKIMSRLVSSQLNAGSYGVNWNASSFSSGLYFCRLTTDKYSEIRKMILIK